MKKIILFSLIAVSLVIMFIKRDEIGTYYSSLTNRTYRHFSSINLAQLSGSVELRLQALRNKRINLERSGDSVDVDKLVTIDEEVIYLEKVKKGILAESQARRYIRETPLWKRLALGAVPPTALLLILILFFSLPGRPRTVQAVPMQSDAYDYDTLGVSMTAPFDARIERGITPKVEVMRILGKPNHRTIFTNLEAWSYLYQVADKTPDPSMAPRLKSVVIIFRGNVVFDFSEEVLADDRKSLNIY